MDLSIIVPCRNEEGNISLLLERTSAAMNGSGISWEIILVDDGSTDGTWNVIQKERSKRPQVVGVHHEKNLGIPGGWRSGLKASDGEYVLITDADLQYMPEDIPRLYKTLKDVEKNGVDIVQGMRSKQVNADPLRLALSKGLSLMLNLIFLMNLSDIKSGFLVTKREIFEDILDYRVRYRHFQHLITISAHGKGYRIHQIPVLFGTRNAGNSNIDRPILFSLRALMDLPPAFLEFRLGIGRTSNNHNNRRKAD